MITYPRGTSLVTLSCLLLAGLGVAACSAGGSGGNQISGGPGAGPTGAGGTSPIGAGGAGAAATGGTINLGGTGGGTPPPASCPTPTDMNADEDGDGFSPAAGDCRDCDPNSNPGAQDLPGNNIDEDCSGAPDDEPTGCDATAQQDGNDPNQAAQAMGICRFSQNGSWGLVSAKYVFPDGSTSSQGPTSPIPGLPPIGCGAIGDPINPMQHGILDGFGPSVLPREGNKVLSLSSGVARAGKSTPPPPSTGTSPDDADMCVSSNTPNGFPKDFPSCPGVSTAGNTTANDGIALEIEVKVPTNAKSCAFDVDFYTFEFPGFICSQYNDYFVALLDSQHPSTPADANVSFDAMGNAISVNAGFLEVCSPQTAGGKNFACSLGTGELQGTGFENNGATSWLQTTFNVVPGETIRLRFAVWDLGDHVLDSTVLLDNFRCDTEGGEEPPVTTPIPK